MDRFFSKSRQAAEELKEAGKKIKEKQDYFDLLDIRISQILSRDVDFLEPLLEELENLLESEETDLRCINCKEKFKEWLQEVCEDSLAKPIPVR